MPRLESIFDTNRMRRAAEGAARFEHNEFMERRIEMRRTRPQTFAGLSPSAKLALGHYEAAKPRAETLSEGSTPGGGERINTRRRRRGKLFVRGR